MPKRLSIRRMVVKELLKGINVPLGTFDAQYDIENTSVWSLGGQRIFLRKTSYLSSILLISMKFGENKKKNENTPAQSAKNVVCAGVKFKNIFDILRRRKQCFWRFTPAYFHFSSYFPQNFMLIKRIEER